MPKQSDIDFANEVCRQALVPKEAVEECLTILKGLREMGVEDSLDALLVLKGHLKEGQVSTTWNEVFRREFDDDLETAFALVDFAVEAPAVSDEEPSLVAQDELPSAPAPEPTPAPEPEKPKRSLPDVPGFSLEAKLERDSMSISYLATPEGSDRKALVFILYPQAAGDQQIMGWLIKHGRRISRVEHPLAVRFYPIQPYENRAFFAQEIPKGEVLPTLLEEGEFEEERALLLLEQVAEVLQSAEKKGVFHGRLGPQNIFIVDDNLIELRFFTFSDREQELFIGEPDAEDLVFIAPEVRSGKAPTVQSDLYSVGKILLRMTGADHEPPKKLGESCRRIVGKLIALRPSQRYPDVKNLLSDLERYFEGKEISEKAEAKAGPAVKEEPPEARPAKKRKPSKAKPVKALPVEPLEDEEEEEEEKPRRKGSGRGSRRSKGGPAPKAKPVKALPVEPLEDEEEEEEEPRRKGPGRGPRRSKGGPARRRSGSKTKIMRRKEPAVADEPLPEDEELEELAPVDEEPEAEDWRVVKGVEKAGRMESMGDLAGAVESLQDILELAQDPEPLKQRIVDLKGRGFAKCRKDARSKEAEGDYPGAIKVFESGRAFAKNPADIDEVIALLEEKHDEVLRKSTLDKMEAKAKARVKEGDVLGAIALLEEAKASAKNPLQIQVKIDNLRKKAYDARMAECQKKEAEGDFAGAVQIAQRAKEFADSPEAVDAIIRNMERKRDKESRHSEVQRCEEDALKRVEEGDIDGAIECYERAKKYAASTITMEAKIEDLKHSTFEKFLGEAQKHEEGGRFPDAILAWERARPYAPDPEEVEAAIQALRGRISSEERERALNRLKEEAEALEKEGKIEEAIAKWQESSRVNRDASYSGRLRVDSLRKKAFDEGVAGANRLKEQGDINAAIAAVEAVKKYSPDPRSADLIIATFKHERSREKRARDFRKLETAAKNKAKAGDIVTSIQILEKAKEYADSPVAVQAKIDALQKTTYDKTMSEAKRKETAGDWSEALALYRKARTFADDPASVDDIVEALEREMERVKREAEQKRITGAADQLVEQGKIKEAVAKLEEAKPLSSNPQAIQSRIDKLLVESMYRKLMELAEKKEAAGDIPGAFEACTKAKAYAQDPTELDKRLSLLKGMMQGEIKQEEPLEPRPDGPALVPSAADEPGSEDETLPEILPAGAQKAKKPAKTPKPAKPAKPEKASKPAKAPKPKPKTKAKKRPSSKLEASPDSIPVHCPNPECGKEFRVKTKFEGRKGKCPTCGTAVDVPLSGEKVVCFLCDKIMPKSKSRQRGDEFYCKECEDFIGGG